MCCWLDQALGEGHILGLRWLCSGLLVGWMMMNWGWDEKSRWVLGLGWAGRRYGCSAFIDSKVSKADGARQRFSFVFKP